MSELAPPGAATTRSPARAGGLHRLSGLGPLLVGLLLASPAAGAEGPYEDQRLALALAEGGWTVAAEPAGRTIGAIHIVRKDVFADDELIPTFFNSFHWLTREDVIRRELLFAEGEPWDVARVAESARNLRNLGIFTIVRVVPVEPADADAVDTVDAVVFTRDLWSVRLETSFSVTDGFLDRLALQLVERNLFGRNKLAAIRFELRPRTWSLSQLYGDHRVLGGALALTQRFELVFRREDSVLEGTRGELMLGSPLRDLAQGWGFLLGVAYDDVIGRQISGRDVLTWSPEGHDEAYERVWDHVTFSASARALRQLGRDVVHRLSFGFAAGVTAADPLPGTIPDRFVDAYREQVLPPSRRQLYPFFAWAGFTPRYATFRNLASFGLTEDVRLGPWWSTLVAAPLEAFGSSVDALVVEASAGLVLAPGGGLFDVSAGVRGRLEQSELIDQAAEARLRLASPSLPFGRFVGHVHWEGRRRDSARALVTLGGDNGLRGLPSQALFGFGASRIRANVELRSPPLVIASAHLGLVAFWDGGAVYEAVSALRFRQSAGLGVRLLFPQFNRFTFRLDLGAPLDGDGFSVLVTFGSQQAVPLTAVEDVQLSQ